MRKFTLWICLLPCIGYAQNKAVDSLLLQLQKVQPDSRLHCQTLTLLCRELYSINQDSALLFGNQAIALGIQKGYDSLLSRAYVEASAAWSYKGTFDSSIAYSFRAVPLAEKIQDTITIIDAYNNLGIDFFYRDELDEAKTYFEKVLDLSEHINNPTRMGNSANNLGMVVGTMGETESELAYYQQALDIFKRIDFKEGIANTVMNTGDVQMQEGNYSVALRSFNEALNIYKELENKSAEGQALSSLSEVNFKIGAFSESVRWAEEALEIAQENGFKNDEVYALNLLQQTYAASGDHQRAYQTYAQYSEQKEEVFNEEKASQINELRIKFETAEMEKEVELANAEIDKTRRFQLFLITIIGVVVLFSSITIFLIIQRFKLKRALLYQEIDTLRSQINSVFGGGVKNLDVTLDQINDGLYKPLSEREFEILNAAISDKNNSEIAEAVFLSVNTVKFHLRNVYEKLGVTNRKEALEAILAKA